jgi:stress response protein YsnF
VRSEGDVLIIPVVEQRLLVEKRWVVTEELHVRRRERNEAVEIPVELRSMRVSVPLPRAPRRTAPPHPQRSRCARS